MRLQAASAQPLLPAKLAVGAVDDPLERAADRVAHRAMQPRGGPLAAGVPRARSVALPEGAAHVLGSGGQPLDLATRGFFEPRFGSDFSSVRVHTDDHGAASARLLEALAYTVGDHVVFSKDQYEPTGLPGRRLLAHELAHVVQQRGSGAGPYVQRQPDTRPHGPGHGASGQPSSHGRVLFVQVERNADTITFVTEAGSLRYSLLTPTEVPVGNYRFSVAVRGNNLSLTAPGEASNYAPFRYRIAAGQPNPADLLRRQPHVDVMVIEGSGAGPSAGGGKSASGSEAADDSVRFQVQRLTPEQFRAITGLSADALPAGSLVSGSTLSPSAIAAESPTSRQNRDSPITGGGAGLIPGIGGAAALTRFPSYPIPPNATGIIWTQMGAGHLTEFGNVGGDMTARGFRYDLWMNLFPSLRETGLPGSFQNDFVFTLMPNQTIVYRSAERATAEAFAARLLGTRYDQTYRFPPRAGSGVSVCGSNCINVPANEVTAALGVRPEILTPQGPADILTAGRPRAGAPFEASQAGRGTAMREWLGQSDAYFADRGLTRMPVPAYTPAARGGVVFIKGGGTILMIYGAYRTGERIAHASDAELPKVVYEEAGSWAGGVIGSALGTAAAGAVLCAPSGPADLVCVVGGFAAGLLLGMAGSQAGSASGGAAVDWFSQSVAEAYRHQIEQQGDQFPAGSAGAIDSILGPPLF